MNNKLIPLKKLIEKNGYEFTWQKQIILETITESETHLNAKEIYEKVKNKNIGIATVYRALKVFNKLGIVKQLNINGIGYFEMKLFSGKPLHIHFKCYKCNNIIDIDDENLIFEFLKLNKKIEQQNNLDIYDSNIMFVGLCSKCKEDIK